jgi:hypothetical protein
MHCSNQHCFCPAASEAKDHAAVSGAKTVFQSLREVNERSGDVLGS